MSNTKLKTIQSALTEGIALLRHTSDSPQLDAEILLSHVLQKDRSYLRAWPDVTLPAEEVIKFSLFIYKRKHGEPIAYLTGIKEFWSREFIITPDVLIPRPETELLIELCLERIPQDKPYKILDLGTGSGIIALTLALERPQAEVTATDISPAAMEIAKANAAKYQVNNIQFILSHWFDGIPPGKFDLIVSNPPYVAEGDSHLQEGDLRFEPYIALVSGGNGIADIRTITQTALTRLLPNGYLMVEHGFQQRSDVSHLFKTHGYQDVVSFNDLAGLPRVTVGRPART